MTGKAVVDSLVRNVGRLIAENKRLRGENVRLAASRDKLRGELADLIRERDSLRHGLTVRQLAEDFGGAGASAGTGVTTGSNGGGLDADGRKVARARVNRLVREIDRCIALLGKEA